MNEIIKITNNANSMSKSFESLSKAKDTLKTIESLKSLANRGSNSASALVYENQLNYNYQMGYFFGSLKANLDCLPDEIASQQKLYDIPLNLMIKIKVDEFVLDVRERSKADELTLENSYWGKYSRLSSLICGFGYNMNFIEERFEAFFPNGSHKFVLGFAEGYSETFHEIAKLSDVTVSYTDPKTQDIWKNWEYFLERDVHTYRLDGAYIFMYHGGFNSSGDSSIPYGKNSKFVNAYAYDILKSRPTSQFVDKSFDI